MAKAIEASHISIWRNEKEILHDVSLTVEEGAMVSVIGPNGCGKSTLLKGLCAMLPLREGTVSMGERNIRTFGRKELARHVAILTQVHEAPGDVTVRDLVWMGRFPYRNFYSGAAKEDSAYVDEAIRETGLVPYADHVVRNLSGGEQQRAWLAVMLAQRAPVLLLDEPTTYLDIHHQIHMMKLLRRIHQDLHRTIIIVVHDMNQAIQYTDQVVVMKQGRIVKTGAPDQIITAELLRQVFGVQAEQFHTQNGKPCLMPVDAV
ncbi:MAG: ABC transporter ATP-binding protein [Megasphaera sp.]|jgi:iron complex transport system ATP-binding protein|nr:ABC transporter ATP-binding protein [Megasphaera sp.]MCH4187769.1 ABC transporter ATP-binding protein [Megasphaera sp.]MCH4217822.1 ABC transporter ATP-binding protein [Megasphaera sp.]